MSWVLILECSKKVSLFYTGSLDFVLGEFTLRLNKDCNVNLKL